MEALPQLSSFGCSWLHVVVWIVKAVIWVLEVCGESICRLIVLSTRYCKLLSLFFIHDQISSSLFICFFWAGGGVVLVLVGANISIEIIYSHICLCNDTSVVIFWWALKWHFYGKRFIYEIVPY